MRRTSLSRVSSKRDATSRPPKLAEQRRCLFVRPRRENSQPERNKRLSLPTFVRIEEMCAPTLQPQVPRVKGLKCMQDGAAPQSRIMKTNNDALSAERSLLRGLRRRWLPSILVAHQSSSTNKEFKNKFNAFATANRGKWRGRKRWACPARQRPMATERTKRPGA